MANNSSTNDIKGGVSYLEVYKSWLLTDKCQHHDFTIPIKQILHDLLDSNLLTKSEYQEVYHEITDAAKVRKLFYEYLPAKGDEGFNQVVNSLNGNKNFDLANDLIAQMENCFSFGDTSMAEQNQTVGDVHESPQPKPTTSPRHAPVKVQNPLMVEAQKYLSKFIILNIDFMAEFWSDKLLVSNTWSAYADVQILEDFKDDKGKVVHEYDEVFVAFNRILIQGDPGCGKSTYVNKIAVDWAKNNEYLRDKFDLVFLISLQTLEVGIEQAIRNLLPQRSSMIEFVEDYYKSHSSEVLLILDGFDEFPEDSPFYPEVMNMMKGGQMNMMKGDLTMSHPSHYSFFTTIVTSRRSHVDKVPTRFHARSLLIKGFNKQSMKQFLQTQKVPVPNEQTDPNLVVLLQNPFFCAIYCSLHYLGVDKSKLEDPYDFVKALVENAVKIEKKTKGITKVEDQLQLLGAFAFQKLNSETLNVVQKLFPMRETFLSKLANNFKKKPKHVQRIDTDKIQLGLLIKKKIPAVGTEYIDSIEYKDGIEYKEEFGFPHQLIAEYLAARYFIRLTKHQLKQLQPEKLAQGELSVKFSQLILSSPSSLPFVRFLLFEYLNSHLHDVRNGRELIFRWLTDEFRFICYCKSKNETQTINDIISLDCKNIDSEIRHDSRFFPTLTKCHNLKSLNLAGCNLSTHETTEVIKLFQEKCLPKLTKFDLSHNSNVGSAPDLFAALGKCNQLERLDLRGCDLSIGSINRLTTCIDDNCWVKLSQLDLSGNRNVGSTPALFAALGKCKQLAGLDLQECDLSISQLDLSGNRNVGSTPALFAALGQWKQLERLDLQQCYLSIESINRLTTCINDNCWVKLRQLDLSGNRTIGSTPALFAALGKCKQLERLDLQECSLSIESMNQLTTCIDDNCWVKLRQLVLSANRNGGSTPALFVALGKCNQLERLDLQECSLSIESMNRLTTCMDENCWVKLSQLDLSGNRNVSSTPALFAALGKCSQLERLDLQECSLSIESMNRLTTCIDDNCWVKLNQLDLSGNRNVSSTPALFAAVGKCKQLKSLDLQECDISISQLDLSGNRNVGSTPPLFAALGQCKQLERLYLQQCYLSIESINRLTTCIDDNCWVKLSQLYLSGNSNVGSTPALFAALGQCKQLERLHLQQCYLSIESINRLTTCIDDNCWVKLSQLNLSGNRNVRSTPALFAALGKCKQLKSLDLQECDLSISQLYLSGNSNVGSKPALFAALGQCKQLVKLYLQQCYLSIESMNRLTTCIDDNSWVKLSQLNLSGNRNVGSTPALFAALGKCKQLERLDLRGCDLSIESMNRLTTCIDDNCWVKLSQLDLSGNRNVGSTPALFAAVGKCKQLESLDLQECDLSISQLDLSGNRSVGSTPALFAALGQCKQLERLDLQLCYLSIKSINRLTTCIDDNCWVKLSELYLSGNSNIGSTPALFTALGQCKQLERLDLQQCYLSIESINRLTTCIDNNCLVKLSQLYLSGNRNVGSTPALFVALGKCKQLEKLDVGRCDLSLESMNRLKTCIDDNHWVKLIHLDLTGNRNVRSTPALFAAMGKCKQLERLDLQQCYLSIDTINRLTTCIDDNCWVKLSQLFLSWNKNVGFSPALFAALGQCKQLETLDLQQCYLSIESINRLTTCIDNNCWVKLSQLYLSGNSNIGSTPALFAALGQCKQLERLDLQQCYLSIESINRLTTCIDNNCLVKLSQLYLSGNRNVGSTPALFVALGKCKQLEKLDIGWCDLSLESMNRLTTCIHDNHWVKLIQLDLTGNRNVRSTPALFAAMWKCKQLERLDLQQCYLSMESINRLTTCIDDNCWVKLSQLFLSWNKNVGFSPALFAALGQCKQLETLDLQQCYLSIESINRLTTCIDNNCLVKLSQLYLSGNRNVGSTPALFVALGKCKQLEKLDIGRCKLSVESINRLTTCIDNCLVKLSQLYLSGNRNVGPTTALFIALDKCKQLEKLDLGWCDLSIESINRLTTCIDNTCYVKLSQLDLSGNRNVGSTPALFIALGKCKQLEKLDLERCDLSIESINRLTTCIDNNCWVKLSQLDLSGNRNVGPTAALFTTLGQCKQLERLDLQQCDLSIESINRLTTCIDNNCWVKLSQLDLSDNRNVGPTAALFTTLGQCKQLESLHLQQCYLSIESVNRLTTCLDNNCLVKLNQLYLSGNSNVGSTPALFTALRKCKQLERLDLNVCDLSFESINRLTTCIYNCWPNLARLHLSGNKNVGSAIELFRILHKCLHLRYAYLSNCSITNQSMKIFLSTFNSKTFQDLEDLNLDWNAELEIDDNFYLSLLNCSKLSSISFISTPGPTECELSTPGQKAKKALLDRISNMAHV